MSPREKFWEAVETWAAAKLSALLVADDAAEAVDRAADALPAVRQRLPKKRRSDVWEFTFGAQAEDVDDRSPRKLYLRVGYYEDGRLGEVFLDTSKEGSDLRHFMIGFAVVVSLLLQVGVPVPLVVHVLEQLSGGPAGDVDGPAELGITRARSMIDLVAQVLAAVEAQRSKEPVT